METSDLDTIIARIKDKDSGIQKNALNILHNHVHSVQGTVGSKNQELFDKIDLFMEIAENLEENNKRHLYDMLSVMNLFHSNQNILKYRLLGSFTSIEEWGLQYVRQLVCCILDVIYKNLETEDYSPLVEPVSKYLFKHNAEIEAIDFIFETSFVSLKSGAKQSKNRLFEHDYTNIILECIDDQNMNRVLLYLEEMDNFYEIEDLMMRLYSSSKAQDACKFLVYLIKINKIPAAVEFVKSISKAPLKKQCLYILARNGIYYESNVPEEQYILSNSFLAENFFAVASSLELLQAQKMEYIFKGLDKEKVEAASIANALVHFAYNRDPVFFPEENDYKVKDDFSQSLKLAKSISTIASIGLINSYSHEKIFEHSSNLIYEKPNIGAILALAIAAQKHHDLDSGIFDLLCLFLSSDDKIEVLAAMLGISILYSTSNSNKAYEAIFPLLSSSNIEVALFAIYVLGSIFACSGDEGIISSCLEIYKDLKKDSTFLNFATLGIALIFMKRPELASSQLFSELDAYTKLLALGLMNLGTGNSAVADEILTEAFTGDTDALLESLGLISSCLVAVGDGISTQLMERISNSSLMLDSQHLRITFPLCLALLYPSNPKMEVIDALEKSLNSGDADVNSLIALGIIGAGTRSARILRVLEINYNNVYKDPKASSALIISQGLVNLGKGLFTLSPFFYDKKIIHNRSIIGLVSTLFSFIDQSMFSEYSFLSYFLTSSISSKYVTGYEGFCKVGKPVDIIGLAGNPNKLSATVMHSLPIIVNSNEKAEAEDPVYTPYIEDVLVKKE